MLARKPRENAPGEDFTIAIPGDFLLQSGERLEEAHVRLRWHGRRDGPVIVVAGGISSGRVLCGESGWWNAQVGAGAAIDLTRAAALGFDFTPTLDRRVRISPHDQARLVLAALDALEIAQIEAWVGASYGAMVGLAFAAHAPTRLRRLCAISATPRPTALARGWRGVQRRIVEDALARGEGAQGLALARQLAMITYRSDAEFAARFPGGLDEDGRSDLDRYLIGRGAAYANAAAPARWLSLSESIDRCDVAPETITAPVTLAGCASDQIAPWPEIEALARALPQCAGLHELPSAYGHDAFLKEHDAIAGVIRACLEDVHARA